MKLGLLGFPIQHSKSPELYRKFLGHKLESYELFSYPNPNEVPDLTYFQERLNGLNITSPYKNHFIHEVEVTSELVKQLGLINTIAFVEKKIFATNTDLLAVEEILKNYLTQYPDLYIQLLGNGAMAKVTLLVASKFGIPVTQFSRRLNPDMATLPLPRRHEGQPLIINACSRDFIFSGELQGDEIFWDYNYAFRPHADSLSLKAKTYQDGLELLEKQAQHALHFWSQYNPKLSSE
jgi:shikimate dehydrogenase